MSQTLDGHIEDLDLDEVVKVVALSRRSGVLHLESPEGHADILFLLGRVISVRSSLSTETVGTLLQESGVLARMGASNETLDDLLRHEVEQHKNPALMSRVESVLLEKMRDLSLKVLLFRSGSFHFQLTQESEPPHRHLGDTALTVAEGLDAEELAREVRRRREGRARDPMSHLTGAPVVDVSDDAAVDVWVVDDDARFVDLFSRNAQAANVIVNSATDARFALEHLKDLDDDKHVRAMVVDLVMPRSSGRGYLGGLEVLKQAHLRGVAEQVFLVIDQPHADAEELAETLGAAGVLKKPQGGEDLAEILNAVLFHLGRDPVLTPGGDFVSQLRHALGEAPLKIVDDLGLRPDDPTKNLEFLKSLLGELNTPSFKEEVPLLVLRFASAFFSRGALFYVDEEKEQILGVGAFGLGPGDTGRTIHAVRLPLAADTLFSRCFRERNGVRQPYFDSEWNLRLMQALGGPHPKEVYCAPLISADGIEAVLYADNSVDKRAFPDIALFEIFFQQAGAAIERGHLKDKLLTLQAAI
ncbi:MAG: DUF4388 domain-containing protein [Deltaproteobacteria bacterium]|nr:DUF4388 domain-containing protein [Deltaproteobacteria bacterium]